MAIKLTDNIDQYRQNQFNSNSIFVNRWSPRAMTGESISEEDFMAMLEAAHWAPSAYNNQHWRFIYVFKDDPEWERFFSLLAEPNKVWCKNAAVLIVIASKTTFNHNGKPSRTHAYDTGAAWGMLALEGANRGLVVHGMQGFDYNRAKLELEIPDGFEVRAMAAVGILANPEILDEKSRQNEKPSSRKELSMISAQGKFTDELL
jgi:nitroreductase